MVAADDEFDMYGIELDLGSWRYVLDWPGVVYGPGWYPFHAFLTRSEPNPSAPINHHRVPTGGTKATSVRLAPDVAHRAWRNEYVSLQPYDHRVLVRTSLFVRRQGLGAMVRRIAFHVDLRARLVSIPEACPPHLRHQAETKGQRVLDLLLTARRERRQRVPSPVRVLGSWNRTDSPVTGN
ncbi:hypothetical protein [Amycolatopsis anabasis]|uniref:hypothetical protein n=1 Tax=Amycolatopsis anabasis TaxID=1840409 RepID=UPI00131BEA33|nr:hypothetical protein [Amycolatopsis anabasis]